MKRTACLNVKSLANHFYIITVLLLLNIHIPPGETCTRTAALPGTTESLASTTPSSNTVATSTELTTTPQLTTRESKTTTTKSTTTATTSADSLLSCPSLSSLVKSLSSAPPGTGKSDGVVTIVPVVDSVSSPGFPVSPTVYLECKCPEPQGSSCALKIGRDLFTPTQAQIYGANFPAIDTISSSAVTCRTGDSTYLLKTVPAGGGAFNSIACFSF